MTVTDKNIELAKGAANDAAADGGGITVDSGGGDKTWQWLDATDSWTSSEHIRIPDGKVFGFTPDTDTYIGRPAADTIAFTTGGAGGGEKVRISAGGKVAIGTDSPDTLLHLKGSAATEKLITLNGLHERNNYIGVFQSDNLEIAADEDGQGGDSSIRFRIDGSEKVRITSDGEVGIGTLTTSGFLLKVQGSTRVVGNVVSAGSSTTGISTVVGVGTFKDDVYIDKKLYVGGIEIGGPGGPGIGTDITTRHLNVTGLSTFAGAIDANGDLDVDGHTNLDHLRVVGFATFTGGGANFENGINTFDVRYITNTNTKITFGTGIISLHGNVGINSTAPTSKLDVVGGVKVSGVSTFTGAIDANGDLDVDGHTELDNVNIAGVSTFVSFLDVNDTTQSSDKDTGSIITEGGVGIEKNLNVGGIINSSTDVQINGTSVVDSALNDAVAMAIALG